jgi:hypothetical protein
MSRLARVTTTSGKQAYGPTSGVVTGWIGLVGGIGLGVVVVVSDHDLVGVRWALALAALGVVLWAYLLRPRIILDHASSTLVLRNPLTTWRIPLATVRMVGVKTVTTVKTDDARYDAVAVGYPLRKVLRASRPGAGPSPRRERIDEQGVMVETVLAAADKARLEHPADVPAVRSYAVVELGLLGAAVLALAVTFLF